MRTVRSIEKQTLHGVDFDNILVSDDTAYSSSIRVECDNNLCAIVPTQRKMYTAIKVNQLYN